MVTRTLIAVTAALLALPAIASADDICVGEPAGCAGEQFPAEELAAALFAAEHNGVADRVVLGALDEEIPAITYAASEPLELVGAGTDATVLRFRQTGTALALESTTARVRGLAIHASGDASVGLMLDGASAEDVAVDVGEAPGLSAAVALQGGGAFSRGRVRMQSGNAAVVVTGGRATVADSEVAFPSGLGIISAGSELSVRRSRIHALGGVIAGRGHVSVTDTLVDLRGIAGQSAGIGVTDSLGDIGATHVVLDAERLTIVGDAPGDADVAGVVAASTEPGTEAEVHVRDSVISGLGAPFARGANAGVAHIDADRTSHPDAVAGAIDEGVGEIEVTNRIAGPPQLDDALRPEPGSPLLDAGRATSETLDAGGAARVVDGDGDCAATADIGAFERPAAPKPDCVPAPAPQPPEPQPGGGTAPAPDAVPVIRALRVRGGAVRFHLSEAATVQLRVRGSGRVRRIARVAPAGRRRVSLPRAVRRHAGRYKVRAIAVDSAGQRSAARVRRFRIR